MRQTEQQHRMTQNEAVFRQWNEHVVSTRTHHHTRAVPQSWPFLCECSDENCAQAIEIPYKDYGSIHQNRNCYIVLPGHEVLDVEKVVARHTAYYVVHKFYNTSEKPAQLHRTDVDNSEK